MPTPASERRNMLGMVEGAFRKLKQSQVWKRGCCKLAAMALNELPPGGLVTSEAANAALRQIGARAVEAAVVRKHAGEYQIFITEREGDEAYAGELHLAGTIARGTEDPLTAMARLSKKEVPFNPQTARVVGAYHNPKEARGQFTCFIYLVEMDPQEETSHGSWMAIDDFKNHPRAIEHHVKMILPVVEEAIDYESEHDKDQLRRDRRIIFHQHDDLNGNHRSTVVA